MLLKLKESRFVRLLAHETCACAVCVCVTLSLSRSLCFALPAHTMALLCSTDGACGVLVFIGAYAACLSLLTFGCVCLFLCVRVSACPCGCVQAINGRALISARPRTNLPSVLIHLHHHRRRRRSQCLNSECALPTFVLVWSATHIKHTTQHTRGAWAKWMACAHVLLMLRLVVTAVSICDPIICLALASPELFCFVGAVACHAVARAPARQRPRALCPSSRSVFGAVTPSPAPADGDAGLARARGCL